MNYQKYLYDNLVDISKLFCENPFLCLYEEEIRARLYCQMVPTRNIPPEFLSDFEGGASFKKGISRSIISTIIRAEYPYGNNSFERADIAIIESTKEDIYKSPIKAVIEIKLGSDKIGSDQCAGFKDDFIKLQRFGKINDESGFIGIAIYFYQTKNDEKTKYGEWFKEFKEEMKWTNWSNVMELNHNTIYAFMFFPDTEEFIYSMQPIK